MNKNKLSWKSYKESIHELGFSFSVKNFLVVLILFIGAIVLVSMLYKINFISIVFLIILGVLCLPVIIKSRYISYYEEKRFLDICFYMEQMCSSFQKESKILSGLQDIHLIAEGNLKTLVNQSIIYLEKGVSGNQNIYAESLKIIEEKYSCRRLISLHKLLEKIEISGGNYFVTLNILLRDIQSWIERTMIFQKNKKSLKTNYIVVLILSIISCTMATLLSFLSNTNDNYLSSYLDITGNKIYQMISTIFIASCIISFTLIQYKLSGTWLEEKKNEKAILEDYHISTRYPYKKIMRKRIRIVSILAIPLILFIYLNYFILSMILSISCILFLFFPLVKVKGARKRTIEEIKMVFPEWLRDIALNLQYQTVQMAIQYSMHSVPIVLKEGIQNLILEIERNPSGIEPYYHFLNKFNLSEVKSAMRMLYSMTELSHEKTEEMLYMLIDRNYVMIDKAQKIYDRNKLMLLKQLLYLPMIFSMIKIITDLFLFANSFFGGFADFSNFTI